MKNQFFKTKIFLSCFIILFCFTGMALGVIAITNFKSLNFNIAIKFNPDFYLELYYFIDNNDNNIVDENEDKILVFNNTNGFKVGDNVDIKENYLNIQTSLNENDNLKFIVINKTLNNTNDEGVNISVFINAINDANPDNLYNISYAHNIPINNETILNGKIALAGKINYKIEISQTFNVETSLQNLTVNNIYFSPLHNYETTLTAETNYDLPESCEVEILTNATNTTYTKLTTDEYIYNLSSGNLIIPTSTLNNIDYNTPTNLPLIKITATAKNPYVSFTLKINSTNGDTSVCGLKLTYDGTSYDWISVDISDNYETTVEFPVKLKKGKAISLIVSGYSTGHPYIGSSGVVLISTNINGLSDYNINSPTYDDTTISGIISDNIILTTSFEYRVWVCCFVYGTEVLVDLNGTTKEIQDFKTGDYVVYYNYDTQENVIGLVKRAVVKPLTVDYVRYELENGCVVDASAYHPIYTQDGWKSLTQYNNYPIPVIGDLVKTINGWSKLIKIDRYTKPAETTYTLDVTDLNGKDGYDNFYANGFLVENAPCVT